MVLISVEAAAISAAFDLPFSNAAKMVRGRPALFFALQNGAETIEYKISGSTGAAP